MGNVSIAVLVAGAGLTVGWLGGALEAAPDKGRGMALMSATVGLGGNLQVGAGALSAERTGTGTYEITFNRPATLCSFVASVGDVSGYGFFEGYAITSGPRSGTGEDPALLYVGTRNPDGANANLPFHVIAFCAK